ncbi:Ig-like domain-containing protein, partial [Vibrio rumoiensis]|uniref:Ig-like domain-containing protein n=1 Tax=Vibrio rumoiensis TaxID=76258 RepID=UPI003AA9107F
MSKYVKGFLVIIAVPLLLLLSGCKPEGAFSGAENPSPSPVPTGKLERIDIVASPVTTKGASELTLAKGLEQSFEATGYYSDGSSQVFTDLSVLDWHSSDIKVGKFEKPGILTGADPGPVEVTATKDGITSNTVNVTVSDAVIESIQVTPSPVNIAKGQTQQLVATATYSDGTSSNISSSVAWTMDDPATATVTPAGLLSGVAEGGTTLTASEGGKTSNTVNVTVTDAVIESIQVTPSPVNIAKGQTQQLVATAT